ncbi:hypothetical protein [Parashewanella spongiae]|nr:hypothetical protein [Parashewanella spongiae]
MAQNSPASFTEQKMLDSDAEQPNHLKPFLANCTTPTFTTNIEE